MKRLIVAALAFALLAGCGGSRLVPSGPSTALTERSSARSAQDDNAWRRHRIDVRLRMTIPRRHRGERVPIHPATISPLTQSVGIAINGGASQIFNATPSSPGCTPAATGTTCTFNVVAPPRSDTFAVSTYSATGGSGTMLDHGSAVVAIAAGRSNLATITLGPVVTSTANS